MSEPDVPRPTMTVRQAAQILGVHENTIRKWIRDDLIEAFTLPGGGFRRPYADSVMGMMPTDLGDSDALRRIMVGKAEAYERSAAALRRAIAALDE